MSRRGRFPPGSSTSDLAPADVFGRIVDCPVAGPADRLSIGLTRKFNAGFDAARAAVGDGFWPRMGTKKIACRGRSCLGTPRLQEEVLNGLATSGATIAPSDHA